MAQDDWTRLEARPLRMFLLGGIVALCVVVIGFLMTEVRDKLAELAFSPADNMQWTLSQFEVEYLEFVLAVSDAAALASDGTTADEVSSAAELETALGAVRRRYDILYSRLDTLVDSTLYAEAIQSDRMGDRFVRVNATIRDMVPLIDGPDASLAAALPPLNDTLGRTRPLVREVLTIGNQALVEAEDATRLDMAEVLYRLVMASLVLLVALSLLVLMFRQLASLNERRARQVLVTSARLETIVSTSRDAILVVDARGDIETANRAAEAMFGEVGDRLTGLGIGAFLFLSYSPRPEPLRAADLRRLCARDEKSGLRLIGLGGDDVFPVELSTNVTNREGAQVYVCVIRDISHQIAAEAALKEGRDKALAGERAKGRFLGVVSHEMRTPLNGILGSIELMEDAEPDELKQQFLPVLRNSSQVLLELVNDVLDITRIEGQAPVANEPFDLDEVLSVVIEAERPRAMANGNSLTRQEEPPVGRVLGDPRHLRQIMMNLVANAAKFTREGSVTVSAERLAGDRVEIQVTDTGMGIAEADLETIFDDFVRTEAALGLQVQGTGLGLGIARQLARGMGGDISVSSILGEGSLFRVTLPLPAADPANSAAPPTPAPPTPAQPIAPLDILMVEDNATNRFVTRRMLSRQGHTVAEAHDGAQAIAAADARRYDLILMDVSMPTMDGIEATRRIRAGTGPNRDTRIVALTAHIGDEITAKLTEAGMDDCAAKPLTRPALDKVLADTATGEGPARRAEMPVLDPAQLEAMIAATPAEHMDRQFDAFLTEGAALISTPGARKTQDCQHMAEAIHALAGSAAVFGARRLHGALARAEAAARAGEPRAMHRLLDDAVPVWVRTREALIARRGTLRPAAPDRASRLP